MGVFSEKIDHLTETVALVIAADLDAFAQSLANGHERISIAVGSGGSTVAAEYFAHCRATLGFAPTIVQTPMEFVLALGDFRDYDIWIFSAGADNPDAAAALNAALTSRARTINLVTTSRFGASAVEIVKHLRGQLFVLPTADPKDGFLATHSLASMVCALNFASLPKSNIGMSASAKDDFLEKAKALLGKDAREARKREFSFLDRNDTIILLRDPSLKAISDLLETSLWESAICPVQQCDFRNFAHGRHVWLSQRPTTSVILALTTPESARLWSSIDMCLPPVFRRLNQELPNAGRSSVALGVMDALTIIEALGEAVKVDPGKPGAGEIARPIYNDRSLEALSSSLSPMVRHKRSACYHYDAAPKEIGDFSEKGQEKVSSLAAARFGGLVLDYDGTIVWTEARLEPPSDDIVAQLLRLIRGGIRVAIATGRGGSVGEMLRAVLPADVHNKVAIGYYNGAFIRTLDVDLQDAPPDGDADVAFAGQWLKDRELLCRGREIRVGRVQIAIRHQDVVSPTTFLSDLLACPPVGAGRLKVVSSQHSFDIVTRHTSKTQVVRLLQAELAKLEVAVLSIGDSGLPGGNDHELLSQEFGLSVGSVCGDMNGIWTVFGDVLTGPSALLRILTSLKMDDSGCARLDFGALYGLDNGSST